MNPNAGAALRANEADFPLPPIDELTARIAQSADGLEFATFVVGFTRPDQYDRQAHETCFRALKVALGEALCERWPGRDVDFRRPDVRFEIHPGGAVDPRLAPLYLAGRYRKHSREIPATRWIHHRCGGRGCRACGYTGNLCGPSVQELVSGPVLAATGGDATAFHGLGREDTDARMLGRGRPFVLEISRPRRRRLDLAGLATEIARSTAELADIHGLVLVNHEAVSQVKSAKAEKSYRAVVELAGEPPADAAERAATLSGISIEQQTPLRVALRKRPDVVRKKRIVEARWLGAFEGGHLLEVRAESGTYIKELISGDAGRTLPSLSDLFGMPCRCAILDVLEVHWDAPWETSRPAAV